MAGTRQRGRLIRRYIAERIGSGSVDVAREAARKFGISRQAVNKHIRRLVNDGHVVAQGTTRNREYSLVVIHRKKIQVNLDQERDENVVWRNHIKPLLTNISENALSIWEYGFQEMMNNAIDHSCGTKVDIGVERTAVSAEIMIRDDGFGVFKKIRESMGLEDERHAIFELSKGKLTTDPDNHTGEGIFFTSRMFDTFLILSGKVSFQHWGTEEHYWILDNEKHIAGTAIVLTLSDNTSRTSQQIFDTFSDDDYGFTKTVVPVDLARYGNDALVSRSQARRVLVRLDRFNTVLFNFKNVEQIGQAFADEVFRVFARTHPHIELIPIHENPQVMSMISRAVNRI